MINSSFTPKKASLFLAVITLLVLLAPTMSARAEEDDFAILRRLGRAFAAIGEKASPAVVVLKVHTPEEVLSVDMREQPEQPKQPETRQPQRPDPQVDLWTPPFLRSDKSRIITDRTALMRQLRRLQKEKAVRRPHGLGFVISAEGHILTNHRVVANASRIRAKLADDREFEARIIGADPTIDLAVLKIDAADLPALELGDADALTVGDWVVGITNSMGMGRTFSAGMVTAKGRSGLGMADIEDFVQTDVVLHPGDGGGPLLDLEGKVVGINTAIIGREQGLAISVAIPINMVKSAYEQIVETGKVERGFLGVAFEDVTDAMANALDLETAKGAIVTDVVADSPASKAGIKRNDIIEQCNGVPVEPGERLLHLVASLNPGQEVELVVLRDGKRRTLTVTLDKRPSEPQEAPDEE